MREESNAGLARLNAGISHALKAFRREANLSQTELATMVGVNQSLISRLERQECGSYSLSTLYRIFDKMNLDMEIRFLEREQIPVTEPVNS